MQLKTFKIPMILLIILTSIFAILSTSILSYISMAVMVGPWAEPIIALLSSFLFLIYFGREKFVKYNKSVALITAGASIGGILATGAGFAFPTLYFLNQELFISWLNKPYYFMAIMFALTFVSGSFGLILADFLKPRLIDKDKLAFPVGEMSYKLINSQNTSTKSYYVALSFGSSFLYSILQSIFNFIPKSYELIKSCSLYWINIPKIIIPMPELPMLISIGLISGFSIALPLTIGIISKLAITLPIYSKYFTYLTQNDFNFSFCSGIMAYSTFTGLLSLPSAFKDVQAKSNASNFDLKNGFNLYNVIPIGLVITLLTYFKFNLLSQIYIIIFTAISVYQLAIIAGKIGLAPIGRFATFVMIPGLILFGFNSVQITLLSTFVEVCGGVAVDALFGNKTAQLFEIDQKLVRKFQWLGLLISSLCIGYIFYILIKNLGLGSTQLLAQRCQTRALTVQFQNFDFFGIIFGALFCAALKEFKINPTMVLGGILMPLEWSIILASSGLISYFIKNNDDYVPLYSGIFAANSIWIILKVIIK